MLETTRLRKFAQFARRLLTESITAKLVAVMHPDSLARREHTQAFSRLEEEIKKRGQEQLIEAVAYTWFNRFCALRFMDVNGISPIGVISPDPGSFQPEILAEALTGHISEELVPKILHKGIFDILSNKQPKSNPQAEAYRLLLVSVCNYWHKSMPFMFEKISDYTELLLPDDLLSSTSILAYVREAMTPEVCQDVEVIGWLYQFYVSEKKDDVFAALKKNKKIEPENIPAATQLFTPHWIVRYLVENSLGRLWMLNNPNSALAEQMEYYIKPEQPETNFLKVSSPKELKICDPACGSGHMLTYAFDLLFLIYEEEGYDKSEIPAIILKHNLYGVEIDGRAGSLASFALTMKAREKYRRFFRRPVQPNICVLENVSFSPEELKSYMDAVGRDLFTSPLETTLYQFKEADNFGSLIRPAVTDVEGMLSVLESKNVSGHLLLGQTHEKVLRVLEQAGYLSSKYHVVVANPPYMGSKGMNSRLAALAKSEYPRTKSDLFAMFIERNFDLVQSLGMTAMITMQSWMFLSSYEKFRSGSLRENTLLSMAHLGTRGFDSIGGEVVSTTAFVVGQQRVDDLKGEFVRLVEGNSEAEKEKALIEGIANPDCGWFFRASSADFKKIPGSPVVYWANERLFKIFQDSAPLHSLGQTKAGMQTGDNSLFLRYWHEVPFHKICYNSLSRTEAFDSGCKWFPYNKGGAFKKWYNAIDVVVDWQNDGESIKDKKAQDLLKKKITANNSKCWNQDWYFKQGITWSKVSSGKPSFRFQPNGAAFDIAGATYFPNSKKHECYLLGLLNTKFVQHCLVMLSPTLNFESSTIGKLPIVLGDDSIVEEVVAIVKQIKAIAVDELQYDELSYYFRGNYLLSERSGSSLQGGYSEARTNWQCYVEKMQQLEKANNDVFNKLYDVQNQLDSNVAIEEISLLFNPSYRYQKEKSASQRERKILADTMKEFISYAVGCMFGRYSLDKPGLVLANQGDSLKEYLEQIPEPTFYADDDNVIPILDAEWFEDDIVERFKKFLKVTFGEEHLEENLRFLVDAIDDKVEKDVEERLRKYFMKDFYNDHIKRYKKRPIYWMFSSPKGSFNALIYMHRYQPETASIVLNDYLREFKTKLSASMDSHQNTLNRESSSPSAKTKARKELDRLKKVLKELDDYERDVLFPLASEKVEIDLDDGVKVNYNKFGKALKKVTGLTGK